MTKFLKKNGIVIVVFSILLIWGAFAANEYRVWRNQNTKAYYYYVDLCENKYNNEAQYKEYCRDLIDSGPPIKADTLTIFFDLIGRYSLNYLQLIAPIFVVAVAIWNFHKELKSGFFKNILTRIEYKRYIMKRVIYSYRFSFILPMFLLYIFLLAYILSGHFNIEETMRTYPDTLFIDEKFLPILSTFLFVYIFNLVLHSIFWINIGYILTKKSRNIIVTLTALILVYIAIFIIAEVLIGGLIFSHIFHIRSIANYLNLANIWVYEGVDTLFLMLLYGFILALSSFFIVAKLYKNKEGVIVENEK